MTRALQWTQYLAFAGLGLALSVLGPLLPSIRAEIPLRYFEAGLVLSGGFLGMVFSSAVLGHLADRFGKRRFLMAACAANATGLALYLAAGSFPLLLLASLVAGAGQGAISLGMNALLADHTESGGGRAMNFLHFFFGVGAMAGPFACSILLAAGAGWRVPFAVAAAVPALVGVLLWRQPGAGDRRRAALHDPAAVYASPGLWACALLLALYVGIETSSYGWIATFWAQQAPGHRIPPSLVAVGFWAALTLGRLLCGPLADRMGLRRFLALATGGALVTYAAWALWPSPATTLACMLLAGLTLAGIYPTTMALASAAFPGHSAKVVGLLIIASAMGGFTVPAGVGRLADGYGIGVLPPLLAGLAVLLLLTVRWARFPGAAAGGPSPARAPPP